MKLGNYIFTNKLTTWGYSWRVYCVMLILLILSIVGGYALLTSNNYIERGVTQVFAGPVTQNIIQAISTTLNEGESIAIIDGELISNKSGMIYSTPPNQDILSINPNVTCEEWFNNATSEGLLLSKNSLCVNNSSRQQIVTYNQIFESKNLSQIMQSAQYQNSPALQSIVSMSGINLTKTNLDLLTQELQAIVKSPDTVKTISTSIRTILKISIVPLIFTSFITAFVITVISLIGLLLFSLITRAIASIMKYDIDFRQAFRISWLPWLILTSVGFATGFFVKLIIWILVIGGLIYWYMRSREDMHLDPQSPVIVETEVIE